MAKSRNKSKRRSGGDSRWSSEGIGVLLVCLGVVLLLSLISYTPGDLPIRFPFTDWSLLGEFALGMEASQPRQNWIGPVGTLIGFGQIQLFGVASYLLPLGLIWIGFARLFLDASFSLRTWVGFAVCLLSGASLVAIQESFFTNWQSSYLISGTGGVVGEGLGVAVCKGLFNSLGSLIMLGTLYWLSFFSLLGLHPIKFIKELYLWVGQKVSRLREAWVGRSEVRARMKSESATSKKIPTPKKKKTRPGKAVAGEAEESEGREEGWDQEEERYQEDGKGQSELPLQELPEPQIIDATQRITPTMAAGAKPFERKKSAQHAALSTEGFEDYELPGFDLLEYDEEEDGPVEDNTDLLIAQQTKIVDTLKAFGVDVTAGDITRGPTITRYEVYPRVGLRVSRIAQLEPDIARATKAERINILAPIPGKDTVGIEIANDSRMPVALRELLQDDEFRSSKRKIPLALGKDVYGRAVIGDLAAMPHLLVAGATGSGKSVCINSIISSILFKFGPDELRFIMIDPKVVEMQMYSNLPHLVVPVVTDPRKVVGALKWCVNEMERRYRVFAKEGVRNFDSFNNRVREAEEEEYELEGAEDEEEQEVPDEEHIESIASALEDGELGPMDGSWEEEEEEEVPDRFPYIVVIIDELADLMQTAPADVEMCIARIAQKARAAGIHLIVATQTPRADVVTGIIKANIPSRIAFQVSSALDSRVILDTKGAEKLVGKGDMLFLPPGSAKLDRAQGAWISDEEVESLVNFCSDQSEQRFEESVQASIEGGGSGGDDDEEEVSDADEEILQKCIDVIVQEQKASTSLLQRRLRLGYTRAARMVDILEQRGIVGPADGARPREVYLKAEPVAAD